MITTAVILAAGRGTRLGEVTATRSKAMVPVVGQPMIERVMREFSRAGVQRFLVVAAPTDVELRRYFAGRSEVAVLEQSAPRGSADALRACEGYVSGSFLVAACDSLVSADDIQALCAIHEHEKPSATIGVLTVSADTSLGARSVVKLDGARVVDLIEKPKAHERLSNTTALPLYVCRDEIFAELRVLAPSERGEYELPAVLSKLARRGELIRAWQVSGRQDLTNEHDLLAINQVFLDQLPTLVQIDSTASVASDVRCLAPVVIGPGCVIQGGVRLGPGVYLECNVTVLPESSVKQCVALRGAQLSGHVENAVVSPNR